MENDKNNNKVNIDKKKLLLLSRINEYMQFRI